jgi:hypothetical protein
MDLRMDATQRMLHAHTAKCREPPGLANLPRCSKPLGARCFAFIICPFVKGAALLESVMGTIERLRDDI